MVHVHKRLCWSNEAAVPCKGGNEQMGARISQIAIARAALLLYCHTASNFTYLCQADFHSPTPTPFPHNLRYLAWLEVVLSCIPTYRELADSLLFSHAN